LVENDRVEAEEEDTADCYCKGLIDHQTDPLMSVVEGGRGYSFVDIGKREIELVLTAQEEEANCGVWIPE
jgi:hypothetical protein